MRSPPEPLAQMQRSRRGEGALQLSQERTGHLSSGGQRNQGSTIPGSGGEVQEYPDLACPPARVVGGKSGKREEEGKRNRTFPRIHVSPRAGRCARSPRARSPLEACPAHCLCARSPSCGSPSRATPREDPSRVLRLVRSPEKALRGQNSRVTTTASAPRSRRGRTSCSAPWDPRSALLAPLLSERATSQRRTRRKGTWNRRCQRT